jgi:hypothetical protein
MTVNYYTQRVTVPTAFVTKGHQRVKQLSGYGNGSVYLKNGDEFEIELFNPTTSKVLAKINLNGKSFGSGIILRPAERVFLERYFDEAKKFLFETYVVEANNPNVEQAIRLNGLVEVEFFEEFKQIPYTVTYSGGNDYQWNPGVTQPGIYQPGIYYNHTGEVPNASPSFTMDNNAKSFEANENLSGEVHAFNWSSCSLDSVNPQRISQKLSRDVKETGRIEKGSSSNQSFAYDNTTFNSYHTWKTTWKILPDSERPLVSEDLAVFCTSCGMKRRKSSHKFCPNCGQKFL